MITPSRNPSDTLARVHDLTPAQLRDLQRDTAAAAGQPRFFPLPFTLASEVRVGSLLSEAANLPDGEPVARLRVRLASGRELPLVLRAGRETAEWAYDRPDVRSVVAQARRRAVSRPARCRTRRRRRCLRS